MSKILTPEERNKTIDRILMKLALLETIKEEKSNRGITPAAPSKSENQ